MNARRRWFLRVLFVGLAGVSMSTTMTSARASDDDLAVWRAARLLEEISSDPKPGIPQDELRQAVGILIIPRIVELRVGLGRKSGHGILLTRDEKGEWGHPEPVDVSGLSVGAEAGHQVTDLVVLFQTRKAIEEYGKNPNRLTIYMGAGLAGHGRRFHHHASTDGKDYRVYGRRHGFDVGAGVSAETKRSPAFRAEPEPESKPAATTASTAANGAKATAAAPPVTATTKPAERQLDPRAARHTRADEARIRRLAAAPSMPRLKATLTALTTPPAQAQVPATGTKDAAVRPAAGSRPAGPSAGVIPAPVPAPRGARPSLPPPTPAAPPR